MCMHYLDMHVDTLHVCMFFVCMHTCLCTCVCLGKMAPPTLVGTHSRQFWAIILKSLSL